MVKTCTKCGVEKELGEFEKMRRGKHGVASECKVCRAAYAKTPARRAYQAAYRKTPARRANQAAYRKTPARRASHAAYAKTPARRASQAAYRKTPAGKASHARACAAYLKTPAGKASVARGGATPAARLKNLLRTRLGRALRGRHKAGSAVRDLGMTIPEFEAYLEQQFTAGMTWENRGKYWHLDHIVPLAVIDLADREQLLLAVHYTNYQPLPWRENIVKGDSPPVEGGLGWDRYLKILELQGRRAAA